jgi:hypothetical protein
MFYENKSKKFAALEPIDEHPNQEIAYNKHGTFLKDVSEPV